MQVTARSASPAAATVPQACRRGPRPRPGRCRRQFRWVGWPRPRGAACRRRAGSGARHFAGRMGYRTDSDPTGREPLRRAERVAAPGRRGGAAGRRGAETRAPWAGSSHGAAEPLRLLRRGTVRNPSQRAGQPGCEVLDLSRADASRGLMHGAGASRTALVTSAASSWSWYSLARVFAGPRTCAYMGEESVILHRCLLLPRSPLVMGGPVRCRAGLLRPSARRCPLARRSALDSRSASRRARRKHPGPRNGRPRPVRVGRGSSGRVPGARG